MPLPHSVARFNRRYTNRFVEPLVGRVPGFAVVHHVGRRSGTRYRTPVVGFDLDGDVLVALTYGPRADWFQNACRGDARLTMGDDELAVTGVAAVGRDVAWPALPWFVRVALRVSGVRDFARLTLAVGE